MTLVVHWGDGEKSIFDGLSWEVHSRLKTLTLFDSVGHESGKIKIKDIHEPMDKSTVYHVWTDATGWLDYIEE